MIGSTLRKRGGQIVSYYSSGKTGKLPDDTWKLHPQGLWLAVHKTQGNASYRDFTL